MFLGFLVFGFVVSKLLVANCLGFLVSKCQGFRNLTNFDFVFVEDIDLMSSIFKIQLDGSSEFYGPVFSNNSKGFGFPKF